MDPYNVYSEFYDEIEGDSDGQPYMNLVKKYSPKAKSILELACGTGRVLKPFQENYIVSGLDASETMLSKAKKKMPDVDFYLGDMSDFRLEKKFDVILCTYDSINHLIHYESWLKMFDCCLYHLNEDGFLFFDMNTINKLHNLSGSNPWCFEFGKNVLIMKVDSNGDGIYIWNPKVFKIVEEDKYELREQFILETSFEIEKVHSSLLERFSIVDYMDFSTRVIPTESSNRVLFVCKK